MTRKENRPNETGVGEISRPTKGQIVQRTESDLSQTIIFANMRHELRTLLNAIIGYSEMLLEDAENLHQEAFITDLQKIHTAGKEMLGLVNEILDPSNVEKDQFDLDWDSLEAKLSYTLRTPLNAVIGYSELLIENAEELRQETFIPDLQKIHSASETFLGLIKEIVNFSKIKAGIMNAEVGSSETSDMVKGVVSTIRPL